MSGYAICFFNNNYVALRCKSKKKAAENFRDGVHGRRHRTPNHLSVCPVSPQRIKTLKSEAKPLPTPKNPHTAYREKQPPLESCCHLTKQRTLERQRQRPAIRRRDDMSQSLELLLIQFLMPDNDARRQAEDQIKRLAKDPQVVPALVQHLRTAKTPNVRQLAAVLLRKKITGHWAKLTPQLKNLVKQSLIESITMEHRSPSLPLNNYSINHFSFDEILIGFNCVILILVLINSLLRLWWSLLGIWIPLFNEECMWIRGCFLLHGVNAVHRWGEPVPM